MIASQVKIVTVPSCLTTLSLHLWAVSVHTCNNLLNRCRYDLNKMKTVRWSIVKVCVLTDLVVVHTCSLSVLNSGDKGSSSPKDEIFLLFRILSTL